MLTGPPAVRDVNELLPWLTQTVHLLNEMVFRLEPRILGLRNDGTDLHLRFLSAPDSPWVQVHVQNDDTGNGGPDYDASNYVSTTKVDCRAARVQDVTITDVPDHRTYVWLIPIQEDGAGNAILMDGESGRPDRMAYAELGV